MRFEEAYTGWHKRSLTQEEAARLLGVCVHSGAIYSAIRGRGAGRSLGQTYKPCLTSSSAAGRGNATDGFVRFPVFRLER